MIFYPDEKIKRNELYSDKLSDKDLYTSYIHICIRVYTYFFPVVYFISSTPLSCVDPPFLNLSQPHVYFKTVVVGQCYSSATPYFRYQPAARLAKEMWLFVAQFGGLNYLMLFLNLTDQKKIIKKTRSGLKNVFFFHRHRTNPWITNYDIHFANGFSKTLN